MVINTPKTSINFLKSQATGKYIAQYNQFKQFMDIPATYKTRDIDKRVFNLSIIKLSETSPYTNKPVKGAESAAGASNISSFHSHHASQNPRKN